MYFKLYRQKPERVLECNVEDLLIGNYTTDKIKINICFISNKKLRK